MAPVLYLKIGSVEWAILSDGTWVEVLPSDPKVSGVETVVIDLEVLGLESESRSDGSINELATHVKSEVESDFSHESSAFDDASQGLSFVSYIRAVLPVDILDGGDGYENQFEAPGVIIQGTAIDVNDDWVVQITIKDSTGQTLTVSAVVENETYQVSGVDLTSLAEGPLTVTVVISDIYGESISANDTTIKDTLADISVAFQGNGDNYLNQFEIENTRIEGSIENVDDRQPISLTITDSIGTSLNVTTTVTGRNWSLDGVDLSGMAEGTVTVVANTVDIAGNSAIDDMPTIVLPDSTSFSENAIRFYGEYTVEASINIENAEAVFHGDQYIIANLTSIGQTIEIQVSNDGKTLVGTSADNRVVFSAQINEDATVDITFFDVVDQESGEDYLITALLIDDTQTDADGTSETVIAKLPITIYDSDPLIHDESYSVVEDNTVTGNVLDNDIDLTALCMCG